MYSNYSDGWNTLARWLSSKIQCDCYNFQITNIDSSDSMNSFNFIQNGADVRTVYAMKDSKCFFMKMVLSNGLKMKAIINVSLSKID